MANVKLSILDLAPVTQGADLPQTFAKSLELAKLADELGYHRFWMAEHHNMPDIASAATSVLLSYIGAQTQNIRIGSGGVMLPNHAPIVIAEQYATLAALFPNRVDLGLGRAPGTDYPTMHALRRDPERMDPHFDDLLEELEFFLSDASASQPVKAIPGAGTNPKDGAPNLPLWLLGSSTYSAHLAGVKGLPFAFASHFAPQAMLQALQIYRSQFQPSNQLDKPYVMIGVNIVVAETDEKAQYLASTEKLKFLSMIRGKRELIPPPVKDIDTVWDSIEKAQIQSQLSESIHGSPETVKARLDELVARTGADEIMVNSLIFDQKEKLESYRLLANLG